jgi:transcriptional regulator with XRE-family HTH domain
MVKPVNEAVTELGRDIGEYIRAQRSNAQISVRQLAKLAGVSNPYLSQVERGLRHPSAEILQQIAKALRISAEALYVQAGILEAPSGGPVAEAIHAAVELSERQKRVLLDVYESFRRENLAAEVPADGAEVPADADATGSANESSYPESKGPQPTEE